MGTTIPAFLEVGPWKEQYRNRFRTKEAIFVFVWYLLCSLISASIGIKMFFDFLSIKKSITDDELFDMMLINQKVFAESFLVCNSISLRMYDEQLDRLLRLLDIPMQELLRIYVSKLKLNYSPNCQVDLEYLCSIFVALKSWETDHPDIVDFYRKSVSVLPNLDDIFQPEALEQFDSSILGLFKAFFVMAASTFRNDNSKFS